MKLKDAEYLTKEDCTFGKWWMMVEATVMSRTGMSWDDVLGDYLSRDAYDDGMTVDECAADVIEMMRNEAAAMGFEEAF